MKRSTFIKQLFFGSLAIPVTAGLLAEKEKKKTSLLSFYVAGYRYYQGKQAESYMSEGDALRLVRQPGNRYDEKAIEVYHEETKLGYIPAMDNSVLANLMDQKTSIKAVIKTLNPQAPTWQRIEVECWM